MLRNNDWRFYKPAIQELKRRGEDVTVFIPKIVALLISETKMDRMAGLITLKDCFPELVSEIAGFSPSADITLCRAKAAPLLARFKLESESGVSTSPGSQAASSRFGSFRTVPKRVQVASALSVALGVIAFLRVFAQTSAENKPILKASFAGLMILFWSCVCAYMLIDRKRWGYIFVVVLALLPVPGILGFSIRLLRLFIQGAMTDNLSETVRCSFCFLQLVATCFLFRYLLSKDVREYVWKKPQNQAP